MFSVFLTGLVTIWSKITRINIDMRLFLMKDGISEGIKDVFMDKEMVLLADNDFGGFLWDITHLESFLVLIDVSFEFILFDELSFGLLLVFEKLSEFLVFFLEIFCGLLFDCLQFAHSVNQRILVVLD